MVEKSEASMRTVFYKAAPSQHSGCITVFDANHTPYVLDLSQYKQDRLTFGRDTSNDIVFRSPLVSRHHGIFVRQGRDWYIRDLNSTNGLLFDHQRIAERLLTEGDMIRIDNGIATIPEGVLLVVSGASDQQWRSVSLLNHSTITIGRSDQCTIQLPHISVSQVHGAILREQDGYYLMDSGSTNGILLNGAPLRKKTKLREKDCIIITNSKLIFTGQQVFYCSYRSGISVDAADLVITRKQRGKKFVTCNHVNVHIRPGELVAIVGGSGAGKSTVLNALCGYLPPASGNVYINGINLYQNFDTLKKIIGYVPQSDIVYDNLTLYDMLRYTAKLRLPKDLRNEEREQAIQRAIETVELADKRTSLIRNFSGGQRKRASIAVELLSDPNLLFLDEPASGLDPGTERSLMHALRSMTARGKTVILVTHSTLQLKMCDKIVFMGKGGRLTFCGSYEEAQAFFGVQDVVDIYELISDHAKEWADRYAALTGDAPEQTPETEVPGSGVQREPLMRQLLVLCARYGKLLINDRQRLLLFLLQAPALAVLIYFVADPGQKFVQYEMTKSLLFALACSAFWIGMLNAIQEICKERVILRREYMTGLRLDAYLLSKIVVLGVLCLLQACLLTGVFCALVGVPDSGVWLPPVAELLVTTFLTALASTVTGLLVSALFKNPDRAMTVAPILLMPQILFSGLIFKLDGLTELISIAAACRWCMEGYGTTANLNALPTKMEQAGFPIEREAEDFFSNTPAHLLQSWIILLISAVVIGIFARIALRSVRREA